ncbi:hypothetical protein I302_106651 [Kwoniella bestiolae CBS 10118]|uniref:Uncharacterized protein n=1 Tax=Kwoniella bestiolae CBS 10118 TaxID=1296100 RepID=A0A1B9G0T8_9TREE|nr:hypothetical protein I302_06087 [Kwoniella bestiolae CBS 10118]OCF24626.1 hypothetical protein I302_06087 [Kwoniella bestiolae CBS 10118]
MRPPSRSDGRQFQTRDRGLPPLRPYNSPSERLLRYDIAQPIHRLGLTDESSRGSAPSTTRQEGTNVEIMIEQPVAGPSRRKKEVSVGRTRHESVDASVKGARKIAPGGGYQPRSTTGDSSSNAMQHVQEATRDSLSRNEHDIASNNRAVIYSELGPSKLRRVLPLEDIHQNQTLSTCSTLKGGSEFRPYQISPSPPSQRNSSNASSSRSHIPQPPHHTLEPSKSSEHSRPHRSSVPTLDPNSISPSRSSQNQTNNHRKRMMTTSSSSQGGSSKRLKFPRQVAPRMTTEIIDLTHLDTDEEEEEEELPEFVGSIMERTKDERVSPGEISMDQDLSITPTRHNRLIDEIDLPFVSTGGRRSLTVSDSRSTISPEALQRIYSHDLDRSLDADGIWKIACNPLDRFWTFHSDRLVLDGLAGKEEYVGSPLRKMKTIMTETVAKYLRKKRRKEKVTVNNNPPTRGLPFLPRNIRAGIAHLAEMKFPNLHSRDRKKSRPKGRFEKFWNSCIQRENNIHTCREDRWFVIKLGRFEMLDRAIFDLIQIPDSVRIEVFRGSSDKPAFSNTFKLHNLAIRPSEVRLPFSIPNTTATPQSNPTEGPFSPFSIEARFYRGSKLLYDGPLRSESRFVVCADGTFIPNPEHRPVDLRCASGKHFRLLPAPSWAWDPATTLRPLPRKIIPKRPRTTNIHLIDNSRTVDPGTTVLLREVIENFDSEEEVATYLAIVYKGNFQVKVTRQRSDHRTITTIELIRVGDHRDDDLRHNETDRQSITTEDLEGLVSVVEEVGTTSPDERGQVMPGNPSLGAHSGVSMVDQAKSNATGIGGMRTISFNRQEAMSAGPTLKINSLPSRSPHIPQLHHELALPSFSDTGNVVTSDLPRITSCTTSPNLELLPLVGKQDATLPTDKEDMVNTNVTENYDSTPLKRPTQLPLGTSSSHPTTKLTFKAPLPTVQTVIDTLKPTSNGLAGPSMSNRVNEYTRWSTRIDPGTLADLFPALDEVWDGGEIRHIIRDHEESVIWTRYHLTEKQRFMACCWNRWVYQMGPIPLSGRSNYYRSFIGAYGGVMLRAGLTREIGDHLRILWRDKYISLTEMGGVLRLWNEVSGFQGKLREERAKKEENNQPQGREIGS